MGNQRRTSSGKRSAGLRIALRWMRSLGTGCLLLTPLADGAQNASPQGVGRIQPELLKEKWGVGPWIWDRETREKQTCRLWRSFDIPAGAAVTAASIRISVDNGYRLMLDGREIGVGSDWRSITEYDLGQQLTPGRHVIAVQGFNDNREAGMQLGLKVKMEDGRTIEMFSDSDWRIAPEGDTGWHQQREAPPGWGRAVEVGSLLPRWEQWEERIPTMLIKVAVPPPVKTKFWQSSWFQTGLWIVSGLAVLLCLRLMTRLAVQSKAEELLNRERARIARDIHDELGARLTELALEGEVIQTELPERSEIRPKLEALCNKARAVSGAMDEVVWMVNSKRDTLRDFSNFACKHAQRFLSSSPLRCRLDVDADLPQVALALPVRRSLLLGVKEAINNAAKYSRASELFLRIHVRGQSLVVIIEDNGEGFDPEKADPMRHGLSNLRDGMRENGGRCRIIAAPGAGCRVEFEVPLPKSPVPVERPDVAPKNPSLTDPIESLTPPPPLADRAG